MGWGAGQKARSMREKIARAMFDSNVTEVAAWRKENKIPDQGNVEGDWLEFKDEYLRRTDAALDTLMEPTEGMQDAALVDAEMSFLRAYIAMIRAAKEGK